MEDASFNAGTQIAVHVDKEIQDLISPFLERRRHEASLILAALQRNEYDAIASFGHRIAGVGLSFGFGQVANIGAALETAAGRKQRESIRALAHDLATYVDAVQVVFD